MPFTAISIMQRLWVQTEDLRTIRLRGLSEVPRPLALFRRWASARNLILQAWSRTVYACRGCSLQLTIVLYNGKRKVKEKPPDHSEGFSHVALRCSQATGANPSHCNASHSAR